MLWNALTAPVDVMGFSCRVNLLDPSNDGICTATPELLAAIIPLEVCFDPLGSLQKSFSIKLHLFEPCVHTSDIGQVSQKGSFYYLQWWQMRIARGGTYSR